jgi:predicted metalloprotease with PDZ domain
MRAQIEYIIRPNHPLAHYFEVDLIIWQPQALQKLQMPIWIPGSYMVRDFSKQITSIHAYEINAKRHLISPLILDQVNSDTWEVHTTKHPILIHTKIYAFDQSVRTAYLDSERGFYNHSSLCLQAIGKINEPCAIVIEECKETASFEVVTSLTPKKINKKGFGVYEAKNYDELIDHPVSLGKFQKVSWKSFGIAHQMVIQGAIGEIDAQRLAKDLQAITQAHIAFFEPVSHLAPFQEYIFHVNATASGYGGLEHRSSTALLCSRTDLPYKNITLIKKSYEDFLGLCSHEYFHAWNVKNIQPKVFQPYQLQQRNHTNLLWLFEGFTSYYDDLQLLRSKRISLDTYLERISLTINQVLKHSGRLNQSVSQSSFDAWTKYYLSDENTPNAVVSYYAKGSLIALALDLSIREYSHQEKSLDDVMQVLWKRHGNFNEIGQGIAEDGFKDIVLSAIGEDFTSTWTHFAKRFIDGTEDLPLKTLLATQSFTLEEVPLTSSDLALARLGIRSASVDGGVKITHVLDFGSAQKAGLAVGDLMVSIQQEKVTPQNFNQLLERFTGQELKVHLFRQDLLMSLKVASDERPLTKWRIKQPATPR